MIAASFYADGEVPRSIEDEFIEAELQAVVDFDRYKQFDALSESQIEEKIRRMEGEVYELAKEYTSTQIANMDQMLENPDVQQDVMERLVERYDDRREKIRQGFFVYVEAHGIEHMVESIEEAVQAVTDASEERQQIREELRAELTELSETIDDRFRHQQRQLESEFDALETEVQSQTVDPDELKSDIESIKSRTESIAETQAETLSELDAQIDRTVKLEGRIKTKITDLKQAQQRAQESEREEARQEAVELIKNELTNLEDERSELRNEIKQLKREREQIETARDRLEDRQETLDSRIENVEVSIDSSSSDLDGLDGEATVTAPIARLLEMDYLGRFDITMSETTEIEMGDAVFEVPPNYWDDRGQRRNSRTRLAQLLEDDEDPNRYPVNGSSRYEITDSRYLGLSRDTEMIIEARVFGHLDAFAQNGFDARPADLDDLLSIVNEAVYEAETEEFTYLLGVASQTGWTERVLQQIQDDEFSRTRFSKYVSLCLIDLQDGAVVYDESDPVATENASLFEPPIDAERINDCVQTIRTEYVDDVVPESVVLRDVVEKHGYDSHIVKRAFNRLEHEGIGEQLFVDDVGLALELSG
jgi:predicted nuclease with TOPRIM domain